MASSQNLVSSAHLNQIFANALLYESNFSGKNFLLICSSAGLYYQVMFKPQNFLHLTGVVSNYKPKLFYNLCLKKDFNNLSINTFYKTDRVSGKSNTSQVKQKNSVFIVAAEMFTGKYDLFLVRNVSGVTFKCVFGTGNVSSSHNSFVIGFTEASKKGTLHAPQTLLKTKLSKYGTPIKVDYIFMKKDYEEKYNTLLVGDESNVTALINKMPELKAYLD